MLEYMPKIIELDDLSPHGEPTIQIVRPGEYNRFHHVKTASEALDYIKTVKPIPGKTVILVLAMTAGEYFGCNRNGDAWSEKPLMVAGKVPITDEETLPKHYKTFETHANIFRHHLNKNPDNGIGKVLKAFYNWPMHRVELLLALDNSKAEDVVDRVDKGEYPAVSMGCFKAGARVTMSDGTRKPIESIAVGDSVLTHKGRARRVTSVHRRPYRGAIYTVKAEGHPEVECTEEHPFLTWDFDNLREKNAKGNYQWRSTPSADYQWTHACCLEERAYAVAPFMPDTTPTTSDNAKALARILGYYVADGSLLYDKSKKLSGVEFTVNVHNPAMEEIPSLCATLGYAEIPYFRAKDNSSEACSISIFNRYLAEELARLGGVYSKRKRFAEEVLRWEPEFQRELLGAYANSDGCNSNNCLKLSTTSEDLASQWLALLPRLGIVASCAKLTHKAGTGFNTTDTTEWVVHIGEQWVSSLSSVCSKAASVEVKAVKISRKVYGDSIATPIRSITVQDEETEVFNFEVEDDESYVIEGLAVHNCKVKYDICHICGNKAPSRAQYCRHAKDSLGEVMPNGKRAFVWNPSPTFFDISIVRRPADRIAYMMKKVAGAYEIRSSAELGEHAAKMTQKMADLDKMSLISKIISGQVGASKDDEGEVKVLKDFSDAVAKPAVQTMPPLDDATIRSLVEHHPAEVLSTLASMGIFFTTPEFIKYFVWKMAPEANIPDRALDRAVASQADLFKSLSNNPELLEEIEDMGFLNVSPEYIRPEIGAKMGSWLEKRSQFGDYLYRHYVPYILKGYPTRGNLDLVEARDPNTGRTYQTTRGVANYTEDRLVESRAKNLLGGGALLGGALGLGLMRGGPTGVLGGAALGLMGGYGAKHLAYGMSGAPYLQAPTGERIYSRPTFQQWHMDPSFMGTEFVEKRSSYENPDKHRIVRTAMDFAHRPSAYREQVRVPSHYLDNLDFDRAATRIGDILSP